MTYIYNACNLKLDFHAWLLCNHVSYLFSEWIPVTYLYSVCYCAVQYMPEIYDCFLAMQIRHTEIAV